MRPRNCTLLGYYFDPVTGKCHPCSDCGPGRSPIKFCEEQCSQLDTRTPASNVQTTVLPGNSSTFAVSLLCGFLVSAVCLFVVGAAIVRCIRWDSRNGRQRQLSQRPVNDNENNRNDTDIHNSMDAQAVVMSMNGCESADTNGRLPRRHTSTGLSPDTERMVAGGGLINGEITSRCPLLLARNDFTCGTDVECGVESGSRQTVLPRHVSFSSHLEYFEMDHHLSSDNDCPLIRARSASTVSQPQQQDSEYHIIPSCQFSLPAHTTADSNHLIS